MKANRGSLGPHETTLIIQAQIEGLTPQQVLLHDELVAKGITNALEVVQTRDLKRVFLEIASSTILLRS